jgi:hypothetical protein
VPQPQNKISDSTYFSLFFVTRGVQKRNKENHGKLSAAAKKSTYLRHFFFHGAPWGGWLLAGRQDQSPRGRQKTKKSATPVVGRWVRGQKRTRVRFMFSILVYRVFNSPQRETPQKRDTKNREKIGFGCFVECFVKTFQHNCFAISFGSVFELPSLRNTRQRDKTKKKVFDMDFL